MSYISEALEYLNILDEDRSSKSTINSYMIVLLTHMLKCKYQNNYENKASWRASIRNSYKGIVTQFTVVGRGSLYKIFYGGPFLRGRRTRNPALPYING